MPLLEDGASLLGLSRTDKYNTSLEKVMLALRDRGLGAEGLGHFLDHVSFSWLVGNGDLHAKNSSVLHEIEPGRLAHLDDVLEIASLSTK